MINYAGHQSRSGTEEFGLATLLYNRTTRTTLSYSRLELTKIARLGGYLARAQDAPPGHLVMWRGLSRLTDIELGFLIGAQFVGN
jgi:hypothetical protein